MTTTNTQQPVLTKESALHQQADAWMAVTGLLDEVAPWWTGGEGTGRENALAAIRALAAQKAAPAGRVESMRERLQKQCSAWGAYWRASDAHGVELTKPQAIELLQDALGVEVEIKDNGCQVCDGTGMIGGPSYYSPDEGGVPCPDCAAPTEPSTPTEREAEQAEALRCPTCKRTDGHVCDWCPSVQPTASGAVEMLTDRELEGMALSFFHALADHSIGRDELEEIKTGLRAALATKPQAGEQKPGAVELLGDTVVRVLGTDWPEPLAPQRFLPKGTTLYTAPVQPEQVAQDSRPMCMCGEPWVLNTVHREHSPCWRAPDPVDGLDRAARARGEGERS